MGVFLSKDNVRIFYQSWQVKEPKGIIFVSHGLGEHSGRYGNLMEKLEGQGISFYASDHRGSGISGGIRGHVDDFGKYVLDQKHVVENIIKKENPGVPVILLGHSLGGLIAEHYALNYPEDLFGLILSAPALFPSVPIPAWKTFLVKIAAEILPKLTLKNELDANFISTDKRVVREYLDDPLVHDQVSAKFYQEFLKYCKTGIYRAGELKMPLLVIHGREDRLVSIRSSEHIYERAASADKQKAIFDGLFHETMNEKVEEREKVLAILSDWILTRLNFSFRH